MQSAKPVFKGIAKFVARQTFGRRPPSSARLVGRLANEGGKPVRDLRFRPWVSPHPKKSLTVLQAFSRIYFSGVEGLPQPLATKFGERWAGYCGAKYGLLLPHGTDALRLALAAALDHDGLDYGGEVIVPNISFIASATIALDRRFGIVLVDVEPDTLLLDPAKVEAAIVPGKTVAIVPVHLFGQPCNMTALREIGERHGLKIIEDAAQAHGAEWERKRVGSLGDAAGFSFQSHKTLNCGEGGALTTNDESIFERAYSLHNVGRSRNSPGSWEHSTLGWNCRPTEYQAALLLHRLKRFDQQQHIREQNFSELRQLLGDDSCLSPLAVRTEVTRHGMYMFAMRYRPELCRGILIEDFLKTVRAEGAPIHRVLVSTIADQPAIKKIRDKHPDYVRVELTPIANAAVKDTVYIQHEIFLGNSRDMQDIAAAVRKVMDYYAYN